MAVRLEAIMDSDRNALPPRRVEELHAQRPSRAEVDWDTRGFLIGAANRPVGEDSTLGDRALARRHPLLKTSSRKRLGRVGKPLGGHYRSCLHEFLSSYIVLHTVDAI